MASHYDVFISYSRRDYVDEHEVELPGNAITKITDALTSAGLSFWFDKSGEYSGEAFVPIITQAIKRSDVFLFVASQNANKSPWTSSEVATAHTYKKKIIPLKLDDSPYNDSIILYLATLDYIEYGKNPSLALERVVKSIRQYFSAKEKELARQQAQEAEQRAREEAEKRRQKELSDKQQRLAQVRQQLQTLAKQIQLAGVQQADLQKEEKELVASIARLERKEPVVPVTPTKNRKKHIIANIIVAVLLVLLCVGLYAYFSQETEPEPTVTTIQQNALLGEEDKSAGIAQRSDTTPSIKITNVIVEQNVRRNGALGLMIQVMMETAFLKDCPCQAQTFFMTKYLQVLKDDAGQVITTIEPFTPSYTISHWGNFKLFVPYSTFRTFEAGEYSVLIGVQSQDKRCRATSKPYKFQFDPTRVQD